MTNLILQQSATRYPVLSDEGAFVQLSTRDGFQSLRYLPISRGTTGTTIFNDNAGEKLIVGKRFKFRFTRIYGGDGTLGLQFELSAVRKLQELLENGEPTWHRRELTMIQRFCSLRRQKYVHLHIFSLCSTMHFF